MTVQTSSEQFAPKRAANAPVVVFDIGNVLVQWCPRPVWRDALGTDEAVSAFLKRVSFDARNLRCDSGERFLDVAAELPDPKDQRLLALYPSQFHLSIEHTVPGTWDIVDQLLARGVALHAITNWSAETWPAGCSAHPRLATIFQTTIVSGEVGLIKPDPAIYRLFLERAQLNATDCVFVDDKPENIAGAVSVGMDGIHFTDAAALKAALTARGLL